MAKVDVSNMIEKASGKLISYCQERTPGQEYPLLVVQKQLLNRIWHSWAGKLGVSGQDGTPLRLERVVRALMWEGVDKRQIRYRNGEFRIRLEHGEYLLFKDADQTVHAWLTDINRAGVDVRVSGAAFASFLLAYDAAVPEIRRHAEMVAEAIRRKAVEYEKDCMIIRIRNTAKESGRQKNTSNELGRIQSFQGI